MSYFLEIGGGRVAAFLFTFGGTAVFGLFLVPLLRRLKFGQTVRDDMPETHLAKNGTPTMGGLMFLLPAAVVLLALAAGDPRTVTILCATLGFGLVGFADDLLIILRKTKDGLSPKQKTLGQLAVALAFTLYLVFGLDFGTGIALPLSGLRAEVVLPVWLYIPFTVLVFYAVTNAANFTDGIDGLASSVTLIIFVAFTLTAALDVKNDGAMLTTAALAGGCLGFLLYNAHPARVIMGDCGSLALGGGVAAAAVFARAHWIILFFAFIYVAEALSVVIQVAVYKRTRRRVFKMAPIHHHFEKSGWGEWRIVAVFCAVTLVCCGAGMLLLFGQL
ncbi:MAG: phospho-N-acetylmuramoyl-pentapeptide-transferase [Clostridiales bacterium]|jgi:phospho-N-acetylmuramoyl-pentapeptide-transferase|nr:phospho-N-acetylmuramoyl-pentapeptide-transferase [Clostridiales bacterium]